MVLSRADYSSKDRLTIKVIQHRSYLFDLIQQEVIGIPAFCARIHVSTATLYNMRNEKYIPHESWDRIIKGYQSLVPYTVYIKFKEPYDYACYQMFHEKEDFEGIRKKKS